MRSGGSACPRDRNLERIYHDADFLVWGAVRGPMNESRWEKMEPEDVVLVYNNGPHSFCRRDRAKERTPELARYFWRQNATRRGWLASSLPAWLTQETYREMILPRLAQLTVPTLAQTMNVTEPYAAEVRKERHIPHPMHWQALAKLVGVSD